MNVGRVGRAHGTGGAFVVQDASADPDRFAVGATVYAAGEPARVAERKRAGGRLVVRLDRAVPRGTPLAVPRDELPAPGPDSFYVVDLVGLEVVEEGGRVLGRVTEVSPAPANDVLELDSGLALPLVDACVRQVDLESGRIHVTAGFADPD